MGLIKGFLDEHLREMFGAYLFVGAGFSKRFAGLYSWPELLEHFAAKTGREFDYYRSAADGDMPGAASKVAEAFHEVWWSTDEYEASRANWKGKVGNASAKPLKIEIAQLLETRLADFTPSAEVADEWQLLKDATVDGVITTNYDSLLSKAFPEYKVFVGQDGLLFSDTQGIAEIYAVHGSVSDPDSLVLTASDYEAYEGRNAYLAAKLMTIFVEHPVLFLGYSFNDPNIQAMLLAIVKGLKEKSVESLRDRLLFVEWHPQLPDGPYVERAHTNVEGYLIPVVRLHVTDWKDVLAALGERKHALPARTLRHLKEQVYDIILTNDPKQRLVAYTEIDSETAKNFDIVFGVGAKVASVGIVGLTRLDLMRDVLDYPSKTLPPQNVLDQFYDKMQTSWWVPGFKYLAEAGHLDVDGNLLATAAIKQPLRVRVETAVAAIEKQYKAVPPATKKSMAALRSEHESRWLLSHAFRLPALTEDVDGLRDFLVHVLDHEYETLHSSWQTHFGRTVLVYDFMRWGPGKTLVGRDGAEEASP